jgi:ParB/RepB/Spo0J family partition protein
MTQSQIIEIPLEQIVTGRANVRKHIGNLEELKESIRALGVLQPILVRPLVNGRYEVVAGARRVAAAREIGLATIPAVVQQLENGDALIVSLTENIQRGNLDIDEEAEAYQRLIQLYGSITEVSRRVHKSEREIRRVLDAYGALTRLQTLSTSSSPAPVVTSRFTQEERREGLVLPPRHAAALQATFTAIQKEIPPENRDSRFVELARAIAPYSEEQAQRILQEFKLHPNDSIEDIVSRALTPTEVQARLSLATARQLDEIVKERGVRPDDVVEEAVRVYVAAQSKIGGVPVQKPPDAIISEALELYARQQRREVQMATRREEIAYLLATAPSAPAGKHTVIIGDAREVLPQMPPASIDLIVTSPPYFGLKEYGHDLGIATEHLDRYLDDLLGIFGECFRVLREGRFICVVIGQFTSDEMAVFIPGHLAVLLERVGFHFKREHIWVKPLGVQGIWNRGTTAFLYNPWPRNTMINIHHEHILVYQKGDRPEVFEKRDPLSEEEIKEFCWSVWELPPSEIKEHPAPFPVEIPYRLIKMYSYAGETVLDPFLGSGTTLQAAMRLGRNSIGIEVAESYLPLIQRVVPGARITRYDKGELLPSM